MSRLNASRTPSLKPNSAVNRRRSPSPVLRGAAPSVKKIDSVASLESRQLPDRKVTRPKVEMESSLALAFTVQPAAYKLGQPLKKRSSKISDPICAYIDSNRVSKVDQTPLRKRKPAILESASKRSRFYDESELSFDGKAINKESLLKMLDDSFTKPQGLGIM